MHGKQLDDLEKREFYYYKQYTLVVNVFYLYFLKTTQ